METKNSGASAGQRVSDFIQSNRRPIAIGLAAFAAVLLGAVLALFLRDVFHQRALSDLEDLRARYHEARMALFTGEAEAGDLADLLADLGSFAERSSGFVSGNAWAMAARLHSEREDWPQSEAAWRSAALAAPDTYLGPLSLFNAAVAAEERGDLRGAIELLTMSVSGPVPFPAAARAQFSIGRLNEALGSRQGALDAYLAVLASWPGSVWANLAQSRIVALETDG